MLLSAAAAAADSGHYQDPLSESQAKDGLTLCEGAANSRRDDVYDAAIQFFATEIRVTSDAKCFPLSETGEDSPLRVVDQALILATTDEQKYPERIKQTPRGRRRDPED